MSVRKADDFIADVERQFDWYLTKAGWEVADRYLDKGAWVCSSRTWEARRRSAVVSSSRRGQVCSHWRFHFFIRGLRTLSCGKAEKSRSAVHSSLTLW
jgi:hypothetical protein